MTTSGSNSGFDMGRRMGYEAISGRNQKGGEQHMDPPWLLRILTAEQIAALPKNLGDYLNNAGELLHRDANADLATDVYVALTGDKDFRSRTVVREFWLKLVHEDCFDTRAPEFFEGFAVGVADEVL
jgi:hypothetical protein